MHFIPRLLSRVIIFSALIWLLVEILPVILPANDYSQERQLYAGIKSTAISYAVHASFLIIAWKLAVLTMADIWRILVAIRDFSTKEAVSITPDLQTSLFRLLFRLLTVHIFWMLLLDTDFEVVGYERYIFPYSPARLEIMNASHDKLCIAGLMLGATHALNAWWIFSLPLKLVRRASQCIGDSCHNADMNYRDSGWNCAPSRPLPGSWPSPSYRCDDQISDDDAETIPDHVHRDTPLDENSFNARRDHDPTKVLKGKFSCENLESILNSLVYRPNEDENHEHLTSNGPTAGRSGSQASE